MAVAPPARFAVEPVRTTRTFEAAVERVADAIERNRLRPGDRLPGEHELAAALGISRPTLRQALRVLEHAGAVEVRRGKTGGVFVASELVPGPALESAVAMEESAVVEALRARRVLETVVTHEAVRRATDDDFDALERANELLRAHLGRRALVMRADALFHRGVVRACHNRTLEAAMRHVGATLAPIRDAYSGGVERDRQTLRVHERQLEAMRAGDAAALEHVLDEHFRMLEDTFAAAIGRRPRSLFERAR